MVAMMNLQIDEKIIFRGAEVGRGNSKTHIENHGELILTNYNIIFARKLDGKEVSYVKYPLEDIVVYDNPQGKSYGISTIRDVPNYIKLEIKLRYKSETFWFFYKDINSTYAYFKWYDEIVAAKKALVEAYEQKLNLAPNERIILEKGWVSRDEYVDTDSQLLLTNFNLIFVERKHRFELMAVEKFPLSEIKLKNGIALTKMFPHKDYSHLPQLEIEFLGGKRRFLFVSEADVLGLIDEINKAIANLGNINDTTEIKVESTVDNISKKRDVSKELEKELMKVFKTRIEEVAEENKPQPPKTPYVAPVEVKEDVEPTVKDVEEKEKIDTEEINPYSDSEEIAEDCVEYKERYEPDVEYADEPVAYAQDNVEIRNEYITEYKEDTTEYKEPTVKVEKKKVSAQNVKSNKNSKASGEPVVAEQDKKQKHKFLRSLFFIFIQIIFLKLLNSDIMTEILKASPTTAVIIHFALIAYVLISCLFALMLGIRKLCYISSVVASLFSIDAFIYAMQDVYAKGYVILIFGVVTLALILVYFKFPSWCVVKNQKNKK